MPRARVHPGPTPDLAKLYELAETQAGYFTTAQSGECGFSRPLLHHHVRANRFERTAHGIYRLVQFPVGQHEDLVVVWLWSGKEGTFSHETALALHELSDALPAVKHLTLPARWKQRRVRVPAGVVLHFADVGAESSTWQGPVPVTTPVRTLTDCVQDHADPLTVGQAIEQALARGLVDRDRLAHALSAIGHDPRSLLPPLLAPARRSRKPAAR